MGHSSDVLTSLAHLFRALFRAGPLVFLVAILTGCAAMIEAPVSAKLESFRKIELPASEQQALTQWLRANSTYAFADAVGLRILRHDRTGNEYVVQITGKDRKVEGGLAAPVSTDGYYLTAGHVVKKEGPLLLVRNENGKLVQTKARVVWRPDDGRDLALIKSDARKTCFPMALNPPESGDIVIAAGASGGDSAGVILRLNTFRILHSAPLRRGDSGGPLINEHGALIGVNRAVHVDPINGRRNEAILIDPHEIIERIFADRRATKGMNL